MWPRTRARTSTLWAASIQPLYCSLSVIRRSSGWATETFGGGGSTRATGFSQPPAAPISAATHANVIRLLIFMVCRSWLDLMTAQKGTVVGRELDARCVVGAVAGGAAY